MGTTTVSVKVCRADKPERCITVKDMIVDTGAVVSAIPEETARKLGITFYRRQEFQLANGKKVLVR